ncbi:thioesterase family protein [Blastococcus sp. TML/M2B]|nr:acyl-CoA thioesterase domain-containing protein [Blastococcus sp. TML/M2B]MBN1093049.1 thioesterase family protein [Blastococcus sp. TML/M2B]
MLSVSATGEDTFRAGPRRRRPERSFGGAVVAQALLAAGATVGPDRAVHSLHAYFLRVGEASSPTDLRVDRVRDGRSYGTRRVTAEQDGRAILDVTASFQVPEPGFTHQVPGLDAPDPESLPTVEDAAADAPEPLRSWFGDLFRRHPFELRFDGELPRVAAARGEAAPPHQRFWLRAPGALPDEPLVHAAALAYASDMLLLSTVPRPARPRCRGARRRRGQPRPRRLVPPAHPGRRLALLRAGEQLGRGRPLAHARAGVRPVRPAGHDRRPGGHGPRARPALIPRRAGQPWRPARSPARRAPSEQAMAPRQISSMVIAVHW